MCTLSLKAKVWVKSPMQGVDCQRPSSRAARGHDPRERCSRLSKRAPALVRGLQGPFGRKSGKKCPEVG